MSRRRRTSYMGHQACRARCFGSTHEQERENVSAFGVHSEVGKLRKVIVHRPDLSFQRLTPATHDDLLFDDVLWVEQAQREHDAFVGVLRGRGVEVFYAHELLGETLGASDEARRKLIEAVASPYTVGWSLCDEARDFLSKLEPATLAKHLIGGLTASGADLDWKALGQVSPIAAALDDPGTFVLPPLPNTLFMRDSSCWIYDGVSVNRMYWPARRREALTMLAIYRCRPMFQKEKLGWWCPEMGVQG